MRPHAHTNYRHTLTLSLPSPHLHFQPIPILPSTSSPLPLIMIPLLLPSSRNDYPSNSPVEDIDKKENGLAAPRTFWLTPYLLQPHTSPPRPPHLILPILPSLTPPFIRNCLQPPTHTIFIPSFQGYTQNKHKRDAGLNLDVIIT